MSTRIKAELALLGITFIWGTSFSIIKDAIRFMDSMDFLALRFILAAAVLLVFFWNKVKSCPREDLWVGAGIGFILWISFLLQIKGLELTSPSKSAFVTGFSVILVPLFESIATRRWPSGWNALSALSALGGLYLLCGTRSLFPLDRGVFLTFLCAIGFAFHVIFVGHFAKHRDVTALVVTQIVTAALAATVVFWLHQSPPLRFSLRIVAALFVTAVLCTALAFFTQNWAQKHTSSSRTALILSLEPVFAALVAYFTVHEIWTSRMAFGCLLIFAGILASEFQSKEKLPVEPLG